MGMERAVNYRTTPPAWTAARDLLAAHGYPLQMRMIDGQLAFPDEQPPDAWRELRVGTPQGMVTLRREGDGIRVVTWGNAEGPLRQAWNALTWGLAAACTGTIHDQQESMSAEEFTRSADLPAALIS